MTYDPIPDLAQLTDRLHEVASDARDPDNMMFHLASLLTGPYARLRGGLLLDELTREDPPVTEDALRELLGGVRP